MEACCCTLLGVFLVMATIHNFTESEIDKWLKFRDRLHLQSSLRLAGVYSIEHLVNFDANREWCQKNDCNSVSEEQSVAKRWLKFRAWLKRKGFDSEVVLSLGLVTPEAVEKAPIYGKKRELVQLLKKEVIRDGLIQNEGKVDKWLKVRGRLHLQSSLRLAGVYSIEHLVNFDADGEWCQENDCNSVSEEQSVAKRWLKFRAWLKRKGFNSEVVLSLGLVTPEAVENAPINGKKSELVQRLKKEVTGDGLIQSQGKFWEWIWWILGITLECGTILIIRTVLKRMGEQPPSQPRPDGWEEQTEVVELKEVPQGTNEMRRVEQLMKKTIPNVIIQELHRVQNQLLWEQFTNQRERMSRKNNGRVNELELFHGTSGIDPKLIYGGEEGFDVRCSSSGNWGRGNYFAVNANYSNCYAHLSFGWLKQIFLVKVLTGDSILLDPDSSLKKPPIKSQSGGIDYEYDSVTGYAQGSQVYITYKNDKGYPMYLITYYC